MATQTKQESIDLEELLASLPPEKRQAVERKLKENAHKYNAFPLSFAQQRLWFLHQFDPHNPAYNIPAAVRLQGAIQIEVLKKAIEAIIDRHEVFRTIFISLDGTPMQVISRKSRITIEEIDLSTFDPEDRETILIQRIQDEARKPFNLSRGPLLRPVIFKLDEKDYVLLLSMHHIISDGWSIGVLIREMVALYQAFLKGLPNPLPPLKIQYADFAVWQRKHLSGERLDSLLNFWKAQLVPEPPPLNLPTDFPRPPVVTHNGASVSVTVEPRLTHAVRELAAGHQATLFMTLLAVYKLLLFRYTGQTDIAVGTTIANRNRADIEPLIGFFVNTLVLRNHLNPRWSFTRLLEDVKSVALDAFEHQDVPFEMLVEKFQPARDLSRTPFFQVMFSVQHASEFKFDAPDVKITPLEVGPATAKFDMSFSVTEFEDHLQVSIEYNRDLFTSETMQRFLGHYIHLLRQITENPDCSLYEYSLLTPEEQETVFVKWNKDVTPYPKDRTLHQLIEEQAALHPDRAAVVFRDETISFEHLNAQANRLARFLIERGVQPEDRIALLMPRSIEMIMAILAIWKAGGAYVSIDPDYPIQRIQYTLSDSGARCGITTQSFVQQFKDTGVEWFAIDALTEELTTLPDSNPQVTVTPENAAYVIYTSGSTGRPKGVVVPHRNPIHLAFNLQERVYQTISEGPLRVSLNAPLPFDASVKQLAMLIHGHTLVIIPGEIRQDGRALIDYVQQQRIDVLDGVPSQIKLMLEAGLLENDFIYPRLMVPGGEAIDPQTWQALANQRKIQVFNMYGPTECTVVATTAHVNEYPHRPVIGKPLGNVRIYILDEFLQPVPPGIVGEIYIAGDGVARGYLDRPQLTAERFLPEISAVSDGTRMYKSGDLGRWLPDGHIEFMGRADFQVKLRGYRIELGEIEAVLRENPGVKDAVVNATEISPGDQRLVAYVIFSGAEIGSQELKDFLSRRLPEYMIPSVFIPLEAFPLTPNGKIDRKALPAPDWSVARKDTPYVAPRNPVEEMVAQIFQQLLKINRVGIHDNFFELGGHSLLATQLVSRIRQVFQVDIPLRAIFEHPTVEGVAQRIQEQRRQQVGLDIAPIEPVPRTDKMPLSYSQQRLWFLQQLNPDSAAYNIPVAIRIRGEVDLTLLRQSVQAVVERHEILRTEIKTDNGIPYQTIRKTIPVEIPEVDLSGIPREQQQQEIERLIREEASRPFDISRAPLFRLKCIRVGKDDQVISFVIHHIISDGWSSGIFIRELTENYFALRQGGTVHRPPLNIQYADFAAWQIEWLESEAFQKQLQYWLEKLDGVPPVLELPTDRPRPAKQTFRGDVLTFKIDPALVEKLHHMAQETGTTLFMNLLAVFGVLLFRYSHQTDFVVGVPVANRNRPEIEPLIGFFVNTLALRLQMNPRMSYSEFLNTVRQTAMEAVDHQEVPFEKIVDALNIPRDVSHSPLFQVMFSLNNTTLERQQISDVTVEPLLVHSGTAKFDLTLEMVERPDGLAGMFEYNVDLFDRQTIEQMVNHFQRILATVLNNPSQPLAEIPFLSEEERQRVLVDWNGPVREIGGPRTLLTRWNDVVKKHGSESAVALLDGSDILEQMTFAELDARANQIAWFLIQQGIQKEDRVGVLLPRGLDLISALLGILKSGAAYVPLDIRYPLERIQYILNDSEINVLLTRSEAATQLPSFENIQVVALDTSPEMGTYPTHAPEIEVEPEQLAYSIYTSGSTGRPKGTLIEHRQLMHYVEWALTEYPYSVGDFGSVLHSPVAFDATITALFPPLLAGRPIAIIPETEDIGLLATVLRKYRFGVVKITPAHLEILNTLLTEGPLPEIGALVIGGEQLTHNQIQIWKDTDVRLFNEYGPTETVVGCVVYEVPHTPGTGPVPIGRAITNTRVYVLDEQFNPVPPGVKGELYIGGPGVGRGYWNRPDLTAERFVPDPFSETPGARLYRTGDTVRYRQDGQLEFIGRVDDQLKIRGYRIEPGEIEAVLLEHPDIREAAVVAHPTAGGHLQLVAYVVAAENASLNVENIRGYLAQQLPDYMIPGVIMELDALPLNPHGKVDRRRLPKPDTTVHAKEYVAPRNEVEEKLAAIWKEVLKVERVGIRDNFFELGGDSILSIQVIARAGQQGLRITPVQMFQYQTIEQLAAVVEKATPIVAEQGVITGEVPLTPIQHWFFEQKFKKKHHWNQSVLVRINRPLEKELLKETVRILTEHHDMLRARFYRKSTGLLVQHIEPPEGIVPFHFVDLSHKSDEEFNAYILRDALNLKSHLNLKSGPMFQVAYFDGGPDRNGRLFVTAHHLVIDGVSWRVLLEDFFTIYQQLEQGGSVQLPPKTTAFKHWAEKLKQFVRSSELSEQLFYWESLPVQETAPLPVDFPEGKNLEKTLAAEVIQWSDEETRSILTELPEQLRAGMNEILVSAVLMALHRWTGHRVFHLELEGHGREHLFDDVDLSRTVGWFTNLYPVVLSMGNGVTAEEILKQVKNQLRAVPGNGIGFGLLKYLGTPSVRKRLSHITTAPIGFNYLGQFDQAVPDNVPVMPAMEPTGPDRAPENHRVHLLDFTGGVQQGQLRFTITFSRELFKAETIRFLADEFKKALQEILAIAQETDKNVLTGSDFPLAGLDDDKLANLLNKLKK